MWKIKDPELKRKMNQFISDDGINEVCRNEMADSSTYIFFSFEDDAYNFRIDKSYFEEVPRNMLDVWKPFPEKRPPGDGNRTTQINQKVRSYSDQIDTFVGTFDVFDLEDSPLINILAGRFWIVF